MFILLRRRCLLAHADVCSALCCQLSVGKTADMTSQVDAQSSKGIAAPGPSWTTANASGQTSKLDLPLTLGEDLSRYRTLPFERLDDNPTSLAMPASATEIQLATPSMERTPSRLGATSGTHDIEWVDWLDEYNKHKEAKIRAEFENVQNHATSGSQPVREAEDLGGSSSAFSRSTSASPVQTMFPSTSSRSRTDSGSGSGSGSRDPLTISPSVSRTGIDEAGLPPMHRRSLSFRSTHAAADIAKSSTHRLHTFFERPRNTSSSTTKSRDEVVTSAADLLRDPATKSSSSSSRKHLGNKIEGWWKSVKNGFVSEQSSSSSSSSKATSGARKVSQPTLHSGSSQASSSSRNLSLLSATQPPSHIRPTRRQDPSAPSSPIVIGFNPVSQRRTSPPAPTLRTATSNFDISSAARSNLSLAPPLLISRGPARPSLPERATDFTSVGSFGSNQSEDGTAEPRNASDSGRSTIESRRKQPHLSLKFERPSFELAVPTDTSSTKDSGGGSRSTGSSGSQQKLQWASDQRSKEASIKPLPWAQTPSPLFAVPPDDGRPSSADDPNKPSTTSQGFNTAAMHREIKQRLMTQKEVCNKELRKIIHLITIFVEEKLQEVADPDPRSESTFEQLLSSALDSQSDFGGDESDRGDFAFARRKSHLLFDRSWS